MRRIAVVVLLLAVALIAGGEAPNNPPQDAAEVKPASDSRVTIGLDAYDLLRRASESPAATVIDTILLSGNFGEKNLALTFSGRSTGSRPQVKALEQTNDATISACKGNAIVSRSGKGAFDLIPLAGDFEVRCELRISGSDRLQMHVPAAVLAVRSTVADGELVTGDEDEEGARDYTLVRHVSGPAGETLAATATGRYLITLLPDATRFRYAIDVHNPNRTTSTLELTLQSSEHLQQIDSAAPYEIREGRYVFSIPPGDSSIVMTGELRGTSFVAPVRASLQYLVIESHPLLRPSVTTPAKRISINETGVTPQYRGALAFETGATRIEWKVTRLEAMHAISFAVNEASHQLFVPVDGPVLGESQFALRNEGAPELVLPPKPEPTYVSLGSETVLMTKNATGQLTVPLSPGEQQVLVQHRQPLRRGLGFVFGSVTVPQLSVPATNTNLRLSYPRQWVPLYEKFSTRVNGWMPTAEQLIAFFFIAIWSERILSWLGLGVRRRFLIAGFLALATTIVTTLFILTFIALAVLTVFWIATHPVMQKRALYGGLAAAAAVVFFVGYNLSTSAHRKSEYSMQTSVPERSEATDTAVMDTSMTTRTEGNEANQKVVKGNEFAFSVYQGLPARFTLPTGERWSTFSQELLRTDVEQHAFIIAISRALMNWLGLLIALVPVILLRRERNTIASAIRERLAATPPPTQPETT
jgi:hypothetical protein